ncbi:MAG: hypothetical protein MSG64_03500 [Pyrinomonadaceae bacterium MAG19_C2-C3]|nr:hypothetical protein [Pyrinomonadaceae bacterium MAG19_C2-C3]
MRKFLAVVATAAIFSMSGLSGDVNARTASPSSSLSTVEPIVQERTLPARRTRQRTVRGERRRRPSIGAAYKRGGRYYARGGKRAGRGGARFGKNIARGKPIVAGKELGKGAGGLGIDTARGTKQVGIGTLRAGKKAGRTTRNAIRRVVN